MENGLELLDLNSTGMFNGSRSLVEKMAPYKELLIVNENFFLRVKRIAYRLFRVGRKVLRSIGSPDDARGNRFFCPVCRQYIAKFSRLPDYYFEQLDYYQYIHSLFQAETLNLLQYSCPKCSSSDRDRLYAIYLESQFKGLDQALTYTFIDFAPQQALSKFIRRHHFLKYVTVDLEMEGVDYKADLTDLYMFQNDSVDMFLCSHVLEHIQEDKQAICELHRILKPNGWGIVMAPILLNLQEIYEDPDMRTVEERWKHFGQGDHVRLYSKRGFIERLSEVGFNVHQFGIEHFGSDVFQRHGIHPRSTLYVVKKR